MHALGGWWLWPLRIVFFTLFTYRETHGVTHVERWERHECIGNVSQRIVKNAATQTAEKETEAEIK